MMTWHGRYVRGWNGWGRVTERRDIHRVSEHDAQVALFEWAAHVPELEWMFAIPNGTRTSMGIARRMKAEGVKKGISDICLPLPRGGSCGLFIEMKSGTGSASPEQKAFITAMREAGYLAYICRGFDAARAVILQYLDMGDND